MHIMTHITECRSTIPILVSDGECSAKMLIRCRELKELTGMHVNDYIAYYKKVMMLNTFT